MPFALIDVGDGTLIVPPPASPPAPLPPAPPPPPLPPAPPPPAASPAPPLPILLPGRPYIDVGDVLGPPELIPAPPAVRPSQPGARPEETPGGPVDETDDLDVIARLVAGWAPDLSDLPELELLDPFTIELFAVSNPPLKGGGAISAIAQAASTYGVDARAAIANAIHEGAGGGIGDNGTSYGPFQLHDGGALPRQFWGKPRNSPTVNAWAWSENGISYAVRSMAAGSPSAKGLVGHAAVYAIVYGFERPADKAGAYRTRRAEYDKLVKLGSGWPAYAAPLFKGPISGGAVDTTPITAPAPAPSAPAGFVAVWRDLIDVYAVDVHKQHDKVRSLANSLIGVLK